jgi:hypothetical protein
MCYETFTLWMRCLNPRVRGFPLPQVGDTPHLLPYTRTGSAVSADVH